MTTVVISKKCPYCDGQIDMNLSGLIDGRSIYCPYCGSTLGYVKIVAEVEFNDVAEDMEFFDEYCVRCTNLSDNDCCKRQPDRSHANYGYPGCKFEP